jgi:putative SOS response-associated peptidase YedK
MCGRYTLTSITGFKKRYGLLDKIPGFDESYNISPSTYNPVIIGNSPNKIVMMKWGFIPGWSKDKKFSLINIRRESIKEKPYFKNILGGFRCLIPADGFYEWKRIKLENVEEKIPYFFHLHDRKIFSFAGLYSKISDAEGKAIYTYAIITCPPNTVMSEVHNRMPVILNEKDEDCWLDPKIKDNDKLNSFLVPFPSTLNLYPVGRGINDPANDNNSLVVKV